MCGLDTNCLCTLQLARFVHRTACLNSTVVFPPCLKYAKLWVLKQGLGLSLHSISVALTMMMLMMTSGH